MKRAWPMWSAQQAIDNGVNTVPLNVTEPREHSGPPSPSGTPEAFIRSPLSWSSLGPGDQRQLFFGGWRAASSGREAKVTVFQGRFEEEVLKAEKPGR